MTERRRKSPKRSTRPSAGRSRLGAELLCASVQGDEALVAQLLAKDAPVNFQNRSGETPLASAAAWDEISIVRLLLRHGADPNLSDRTGGTPLMLAAQHAALELVRLLVRSGADPSAVDRRGNSVLMHALWREDEDADMQEIVRELLRAGADPEVKNQSNERARDVIRARGLSVVLDESAHRTGNGRLRASNRSTRKAVA